MEYSTLLLDQTAWDLVLDAHGNIALAAPPYALAQDVASAARTFKGEVYYDTLLGVSYFSDAPAAILTQQISDQALTISGVVSATTTVDSFDGETLIGSLTFTDENDQTTVVGLG